MVTTRTTTIILAAVMILAGCTAQGESSGEPAASYMSSAEKVEVYHFHGTQQCYSCIRVGDLAEKTINTYYSEEVADGKIVFAHINGQAPENQALVSLYGATGSSLWIGTTIEGSFHKEQSVLVWYKINNEEDYMNYLQGVLDKRLAGDLT